VPDIANLNLEPMSPRSIRLSVVLMVATIAAGLLVRFAPLGLPYSVVKYGGSMLWALMIYWIVSALAPSLGLPVTAIIAGVLATAVEFLKLYRTPTLDAFRLTLPGIILLGRFFSLRDIAAYWFAILCGAFIDARLRPRPPI
jgi:hypothetical protein